MTIYLILLLGSLFVPLALSFDKKLQFYKKWKVVLPSIAVVAIVYILCDIYLTQKGIWGFNPEYHSKKIFGLPIEEWLFFIIIPYASLFLHYAFVLYFPKIKVSTMFNKWLSYGFIIASALIILFNPDKTYTVYILAFTIGFLVLTLASKLDFLRSYYVTFLLILIPFLLVNSILTGSFIEGEVVWYNNAENLGIRLFTIPVEDFAYAFSLIGFNLFLIERFTKKN